MELIETFNDDQIQSLHNLYKLEWWTKDRTLKETKACVEGSQLCLGVLNYKSELIGFIRVLSDYSIKALIFDLIVAEAYRKQGIAEKLMQAVKQHHTLSKVKQFELYCLPEMVSYYEKFDFSADVGGVKLMRNLVKSS